MKLLLVFMKLLLILFIDLLFLFKILDYFLIKILINALHTGKKGHASINLKIKFLTF